MSRGAGRIEDLGRVLGHDFARPELLAEALTHASLAGAGGSGSYERLEFLGDRVLGLVVADLLMARFPDESEGALAQRLARLVDRDSLVAAARAVGLGAWLRMAEGETAAGTRDSDAVLADAMEAVIGAVYRDGGLAAAQALIARLWAPALAHAGAPPKDAKTALQEWAQGRGKAIPAYRTVGRSGPDHAPRFTVEVTVEGLAPAQGEGGSRRAAERAAAARLLAAARGEEGGAEADDGG